MFGRKKPADPSAEWTKTGSFVHKPKRGWLHSDNSLMEGGVCYAVKYVGCLQVLKSMRTLQYDMRQQVTREAILRCSEAAGYHLGRRKKAAKNIQKLLGDIPGMGHSGMSVNMMVSSEGIKLTSIENGRVIANHDMQGISFASGGEKDCIDMIGYVAKDSINGRACFVVDCGGELAYDVINTIGQAFEIRFKMFLQNPPLATEVPERFSESIFDEGEDHTYEMEYEQPKNDGYHVQLPSTYQTANANPGGYMALRSNATGGFDTYDNPNKASVGHGYDVPRSSKTYTNRQMPAGIRDYNNALATSGAFGNSNGIAGQTASLPFAAGPCYEDPDKVAFYENPLAAPKVPQRNDSLEEHPGDPKDSSLYDNPNSPMDGSEGWAVFDREVQPPPPPPPSMATNPANQDYMSPQPTKKKPPPKPKPYAASRSVKQELPAVSETTAQEPIPLEAEVWYHGPMSRAEAELLLEDEGDFLVRESKSKAGQYVLSGVQNSQPRHLLLVDPQGKVRTKDREFSSVQELVEYHLKNSLPIISSGSQVTISNPVLKH
ncbi:SHC (Src y 2 domain containing) transforming protein [Porites harrisoni]